MFLVFKVPKPALESPEARFRRLRKEGELLACGEKFWQAVSLWNQALEDKGDGVTDKERSEVLEMKAQALMQVGEKIGGWKSLKITKGLGGVTGNWS